MIRPLRAAHRVAWIALALGVPPLLLASVAARRPLTIQEPVRLHGAWAATLDLGGEPLRVRATAPNELEIGTARTPPLPDLLVYWSARPATTDGLPDDAVLLGRVPSPGVRRLALPGPGGALVVYSLAQQRVVDALGLGR